MLLLLLDERVPQNHPARLCYQLHVQILYIVMAPEVHPPAPQALTLLIELHHNPVSLCVPERTDDPEITFLCAFSGLALGLWAVEMGMLPEV